MKILIVGGGGREHALAVRLHEDAVKQGVAEALHLYGAPGNPGMENLCTRVSIPADKVEELAAFAKAEAIDWMIIGPEVPLALGLADRCAELGLSVFGPMAAAAQMESSKSYAKKVMQECGIPTPRCEVFTNLSEALSYVRDMEPPIVIKADGLAAGKGVTIAHSREEAVATLQTMMADRTFGVAGDKVVIEEYLEGTELSVMAFVDQSGFVIMPAAQDHKAVFDGDQGPNTGGMGTFAPAVSATSQVMQKVREQVFERITDYFKQVGIVYRGVLFAGLMVVDEQPYVIEFNARFGDPETQVVLELLDSPLTDILAAVMADRVAHLDVQWSTGAAVCVVLTAQGYPGEYRTGDPITGLEQIPALGSADGSRVVRALHAGTARGDTGELITHGGRVMNIVAHAKNMAEAKEIVYAGVAAVDFVGKHYRRDIVKE